MGTRETYRGGTDTPELIQTEMVPDSPPDPDEDLRLAIEGASTLQELKDALIRAALKARPA